MTATQRHGDCEVVTTMRGRLAATCPYPNLSSATLSPDVALRFAEAEARRAVSEALAPREASPKLEAAERSLRKVAALDESQWDYPVKRDIGYSRQIASELDRIRATVARLEAENAALRGEASHEVYIAESCATFAITSVANGHMTCKDPKAAMMAGKGEEVFCVRLAATKVRP